MLTRIWMAIGLVTIGFSGLANGQDSGNSAAPTGRLNPLTTPESNETVSAIPDRIGLNASGAPDAESLGEIRATLVSNLARTEAVIQLEVRLAPECHIYSLTLNDGRQTKIDVSHSAFASVSGPAQPSRTPDPVSADSGDPAESWSENVSFFVPLQLNNLPEPGELLMLVRINGMICSDKGFCIPVQDRVVRAKVLDSVERLPVQTRIPFEESRNRDQGVNNGGIRN